jgi:hypothetical protein
MVKKVISHPSPRHLDDFLALCIVKEIFPFIEMEYKIPDKKDLDNEEIMVLDVGGMLDFDKNNFDHHQLATTDGGYVYESSLSLVLKKFIDKNKVPLAIKQIGFVDNYGLQTATKLGVISDKGTRFKITIIKGLIFSWGVCDVVYKSILSLYKDDADELEMVKFIDYLYHNLELSCKQELDESIRRYELECVRFENTVSDGNFVDINSFKVFVSGSVISMATKLFTDYGCHFVICRNSFNNNHTSIIKNTTDKRSADFDLNKLKNGFEVVFMHKSGFMLVINEEFEKCKDKILNKMRKELI